MQAKVYLLVVRGRGNKDIANELGLGEKTIKYHLGHIFIKYGVQTRAELIVDYFERILAKDASGQRSGA